MPLRWKSGGNGAVLIGAVLVTAMGSVLAIDMPIYFNTQNQLQTTVDAAALAAAANYPWAKTKPPKPPTSTLIKTQWRVTC